MHHRTVRLFCDCEIENHRTWTMVVRTLLLPKANIKQTNLKIIQQYHPILWSFSSISVIFSLSQMVSSFCLQLCRKMRNFYFFLWLNFSTQTWEKWTILQQYTTLPESSALPQWAFRCLDCSATWKISYVSADILKV